LTDSPARTISFVAALDVGIRDQRAGGFARAGGPNRRTAEAIRRVASAIGRPANTTWRGAGELDGAREDRADLGERRGLGEHARASTITGVAALTTVTSAGASRS